MSSGIKIEPNSEINGLNPNLSTNNELESDINKEIEPSLTDGLDSSDSSDSDSSESESTDNLENGLQSETSEDLYGPNSIINYTNPLDSMDTQTINYTPKLPLNLNNIASAVETIQNTITNLSSQLGLLVLSLRDTSSNLSETRGGTRSKNKHKHNKRTRRK